MQKYVLSALKSTVRQCNINEVPFVKYQVFRAERYVGSLDKKDGGGWRWKVIFLEGVAAPVLDCGSSNRKLIIKAQFCEHQLETWR